MPRAASLILKHQLKTFSRVPNSMDYLFTPLMSDGGRCFMEIYLPWGFMHISHLNCLRMIFTLIAVDRIERSNSANGGFSLSTVPFPSETVSAKSRVGHTSTRKWKSFKKSFNYYLCGSVTQSLWILNGDLRFVVTFFHYVSWNCSPSSSSSTKLDFFKSESMVTFSNVQFNSSWEHAFFCEASFAPSGDKEQDQIFSL